MKKKIISKSFFFYLKYSIQDFSNRQHNITQNSIQFKAHANTMSPNADIIVNLHDILKLTSEKYFYLNIYICVFVYT